MKYLQTGFKLNIFTTLNKVIVLYCSILYFILFYFISSHALKKTANQKPGLPLHILWYSTVLSRHYLRATVYWGPFEDFSKAGLQNVSTLTDIFNHVREFSDNFRTLPKISEDFPKIL